MKAILVSPTIEDITYLCETIGKDFWDNFILTSNKTNGSKVTDNQMIIDFRDKSNKERVTSPRDEGASLKVFNKGEYIVLNKVPIFFGEFKSESVGTKWFITTTIPHRIFYFEVRERTIKKIYLI